jgi:hypothetical protein
LERIHVTRLDDPSVRICGCAQKDCLDIFTNLPLSADVREVEGKKRVYFFLDDTQEDTLEDVHILADYIYRTYGLIVEVASRG